MVVVCPVAVNVPDIVCVVELVNDTVCAPPLFIQDKLTNELEPVIVLVAPVKLTIL